MLNATMPPKPSQSSQERERGASCSLVAVKHFLRSGTSPDGYTSNDKRALRRRAKAFVLINDDLYFIRGRSRHNKALLEKVKDEEENPENEPDHTQILRKVLFSAEEQQDVVDKAHIADDGSHYGMEKTIERVSNFYYWMGITSTVRNTIYSCLACSSRSKNIPPGFNKTNDGFLSGSLPPTSKTSAAVVARNPEAAVRVDSESIGDGADSVDVDVGALNEDFEASNDSPQLVQSAIIKKELGKQTADLYYVPKDICSYFWQKVEVQIFGPYKAGGKQMYVAVALDTYSQFPDATTMEVLSPATLSHFILNLFCRYGEMEKLLLLQSPVTRNKEYYLSKSMLEAGISPVVLFPQANPLDARWMRITRNLKDFVEKHPDFWSHCLEAFLVPLRISLPPEADYSPYFLAHGREAPVPAALSRTCNISLTVGSEIQLTEEQEKKSIEMVTAAYGINTDNPSIPITSSLPHPPTQSGMGASVEALPNGDMVVRLQPSDDAQGKRRTNKRQLRSGTRKEEEEMEAGRKEAKGPKLKETVKAFSEQLDDWDEPEDDSDKDVTYEPVKQGKKKSLKAGQRTKFPGEQQLTRTSTRERRATLKAQEMNIVFVKLPTASTRPMVKGSKDGNQLPETTVAKTDNSVKQLQGSSSKIVKLVPKGFITFTKVKKKRNSQEKIAKQNMKKLPLDTFYFILKQFKEHGTFPPGMSEEAKQIISLCKAVELKDGKLCSSLNKSAGRRIIMSEKTRLGVLRKVHARGEEHHGRTKALKSLAEMNVFWKGMSLDLDAFIHACPECFIHNLQHNQSVVSIPSKSAALSAGGRGEDDNHLSEDEDEDCTYEDVMLYLKDQTFPETATSDQQSCIKQRSELFSIMDDSLFYCGGQNSATDRQPRKVLLSKESRAAAIEEAHLEDGNHLSPQDTQEKLRQKFFWAGMTFDVMAHIVECCMKDALSCATAIPHRNPTIHSKVKQFHKYYTEKEVPCLDKSLLMSSRNDTESSKTAHDGDSVTSKDSNEAGVPGDQICSVSGEQDNELEVETRQIVESIVADIGKSMSVEEKSADYRWSTDGRVDVTKKAPVINLRKDAHKCPYCGVFVSGNVAFRVHQYKHTGVKPYSCDTCGKSFTTSKSLQIHTRKHTGIKPYLCNRCGREFFRSTSFRYHLKTHTRTKGKPLPCDQCNREFLTQNRLDKHKEYKHPAEPKVYMCKYCGKVFTAARSLKWHEQSHTNPRKYHCPVCSKEFPRKDHVDAHARATHTAEELEAHKKASKPQRSAQRPPPPSQHHTDQQLQEQHIHQLLPQFLQQTVESEQSAAAQQQQNVQVLQNVEIPASNISVIQWSQEEEQQQTANHISLADHHAPTHITISSGDHITVSEHHLVTDVESYQTHSAAQPLQHTTVHILAPGQLPLRVSAAKPHPPHPFPASSTATSSQLQTLHALQQAGASEVVLKQEAVPVEYEVECMSGDTATLTQADLNAVQLLAHASLGNHSSLQ